jgi:hypothetical protein
MGKKLILQRNIFDCGPNLYNHGLLSIEVGGAAPSP